MDFPIHVDRKSIELPIVYFKGPQVVLYKLLCISVIKIYFYFAWCGISSVCQSTCFQASWLIKDKHWYWFVRYCASFIVILSKLPVIWWSRLWATNIAWNQQPTSLHWNIFSISSYISTVFIPFNPLYTETPLTNTFGSSENPGEMQHNAAFHQGLHCL